MSNWTCAHTNKCKASYIFLLKEKPIQIKEGGYAEPNENEHGLEQSEYEFEGEIEQKINLVANRHKQY